jgi:STE24 endopeptidase
MDGSKRSNHSNAYFSGLGSRKKIVLYDTLIEKHTKEEIVATIAHEVGHYKKGHIMSGLIWQVIYSGIVYYILSLFLNNPEMSKAINVDQSSFYANVFAFAILYSPISQILSVISNIASRKHEFEADAYAKETYDGKALADALKKLSVDNLSNPKPHPVCVFMNYSHPPLLKRLEKLNS